MTETADRPADAGRPTVPLVDDHYAVALPASYRHDVDAVRTRRDIRALESLTAGEFTAATQTDAQKGRWRFTLVTAGAQVPLSAIMPALQSLGVDVIDQQPYPVTNTAGTPCWIYDFGIVPAAALHRDNVVELQAVFTEAFEACWNGVLEIDRLNQLVLRAGLSWNQVAVLRSYVCYLRQAKFPYGGARVANALLDHPDTAASLTRWFEATFHPDRHNSSIAHAAASDLQHQIDAVESLEDDRILRALREVMQATVRTTVYRREVLASNTSQDCAVAHKLTPQIMDIAEFPEPRPRFEVFVYSPRVEGVHLRFGHVARGGLRWSDRRDDYRTEVLGLVKAQAIKNAVIVPLGAKGGFVVKRPHMSSGDARSDRQATHAEGVECYRQFIAALLDLTDNIDTRSGAVVAPPRVVCLDDTDPYLVVAADKGTATFSDAANHIAAQYDYWLGDAFASGGTHGYDHKSMGITARGAWQSVRRHLAEQGRNPDLDEITVAGIGDMSGDVFGNAMLLSRHLKLVAAFDHRHIFIDPHPDPAQSLAERKRLFELPRSSWADYDTRLISHGGGVWPRNRKTIPVSEHAAVALGLAEGDTVVSPTEMIKVILRAPVDLLFNGGVGTFVKASDEADTAVGDKANDPVRVDAATLRAGVIAEGGNLGVTSAGRVEFARAGGRINNDALDNCAGVSCSDHEVNIKILLADGVAGIARDTLLAEMTDEVAELVLAENRSQNRVLGITRTHAASSLHVHARIIRDLERRIGLNPALEGLPTPREVRRRADNGEGLTSPELAILLAHVKLDVKHDLLASSLTNEPAVADWLVDYFPQPLRTRHLDRIRAHRLHGEIAATMLANDAIDTGGLTYVHRLTADTGADTAEAIRAFVVATTIFDVKPLWRDIAEAALPVAVTDELLLQTRRVLDRASRWLLTHRPEPLNIAAEVARFRPRIRLASGGLTESLQPTQVRDLHDRIESAVDAGTPRLLATRVHTLLDAFSLLDVIEVSDTSGREVTEVAELYFALADDLNVITMLKSVSGLDHADRWHALARLTLREDIYGSMRALCRSVLAHTESGQPLSDKIADWASLNTARLQRTRSTLGAALETGQSDVVRLSVAVRQIRNLAHAGA